MPVWLRWTGDWHVRRRIGCVNCSVGQLDSAITELKEISTDYELTAINVDLTASAVERMKELKGLRKLELYGSRSSMEPEASRENYIRTRTNALRRSLPGVEVSITIVDFT